MNPSAEAEAGTEVVVRRCTVSVARRGGWSWGPAPQQLVRQVVEALPGLLSARYGDALAAGADLEITEPVTIEVAVTLAGLLAGLAKATTPPVETAGMSTVAAASAPGQTTALVRPAASAGATWPDTAIPNDAAGPDPASEAGFRPAVQAGRATGPGRRGANWLVARGDLDRLLRLLPEQTRRIYDPARAVDADAPRPAPGPVSAPTGAAAAPARRTGEVEVDSVLPFLVASALHRVGLLETVGPALAGAGLGGDVSLFAAALGYKALSTLALGWRRSTSDRTAAAAFAGLADDVPDEALVDLARRAGPASEMLDALVGLTLCRGHQPDQPLLLAGVREPYGGGLLLVEPEGLFPVAWAGAGSTLLPYWQECGSPLVLVGGRAARPQPLHAAAHRPPESARGRLAAVQDGAAGGAVRTPALAPPLAHLAELAGAGVPLVADIPPARGERWHRLPGARRRWVAGPAGHWATARLVTQAAGADLTGLTARLDELVTTMAQRRAVPLAAEPALERTLTLLTTTGLGTIAWLLWRHRDSPDPQLTLARLGDLGGLVRFDTTRVRVRLPYGRRQADLEQHGLLADVPHVPWLEGRTLTFDRG